MSTLCLGLHRGNIFPDVVQVSVRVEEVLAQFDDVRAESVAILSCFDTQVDSFIIQKSVLLNVLNEIHQGGAYNDGKTHG